jgi:serpin B
MRRYLPALLVALACRTAVARPDTPPAPWSPDMQAVADGSTHFAFDLFARLGREVGNSFVSPYSLHAALAMAADGANGPTRDQMVKALHLPAERGKALSAGDLARYYGRPGRPYELAVANALWGQKGFPWKPAFVARQKARFGAELSEVDFAGNPADARRQINAWASERTRGKIPEALAPDDITTRTRTALVNAVYFKSDWKTKFNKAATADAPFHLADGSKVVAPLMHQQSEFRYAAADGVQVLELLYKGGDLAMAVILPAKSDGLSAVEKTLRAEIVAKWLKAARERPVRAWLPRFRVEAGSSLGDALIGLGMTAAFDDMAADFSGLADKPTVLSKVVQRGFVDVNEEGTEAAVVSGGFASDAPSPVPEPPVDFRADRPFLYLIRDMQHGTVLFMGRMANPKR